MTTSPTATDGEARPRLEVLSPAAIRRIHTATLDVIERVGVRFPSARAQAIWAANGATVDRESGIVRVPGHIIEAALKTAPPSYVLAARNPVQDLPLDGRHVHLATDGCGIEVLDPWTLDVRRSTLADVADIARVADALDEIAFHWVAVSAQDRPPVTRPLEEIAAVWRNSTKHAQSESVVTGEDAATVDRDVCGDRRRAGRPPRTAGVLDDAVHDQPARP